MTRFGFLSATASLVLSLSVLHGSAAQDAKPWHEVETAAAWKAFEARQYADAIRHAEKVIDEFEGYAAKTQRGLTEAKVEVPLGKLADQQKAEVFKLGPLNDVAASGFIRARSLFKLGRIDESKKAFAAVAKLPSARVYTPVEDLFWAPAPIAERAARDPSVTDKASHELGTADAWDTFNRGDFRASVKHADACLDQYLKEASALQTDLTKRNQIFPVGAVSEAEKQAIHRNGLLNDAATCAFIKGRSAERLGDRDGAIRAYEVAARLSLGRCWDPQGWFWSPATASAERLELLK